MSHAIVVKTTGGPEVLELRSISSPEVGPDELLVNVAAAGVNFIDIYHRTGQYPMPLPFTPGGEGAGTVAAIGPEVTDFAVGDRVAWTMASASYASQVAIPTRCAVRVPEGVHDHLAAAVMTQGITAQFLTRSIADLREGDIALVHAGAGGVGLLLTQMLRRIGVRVISTVSSTEKAEQSRSAGAEPIVGYDDFAAQVRDMTGGTGARVVYDGVGAATFDGSLDAVAVRGTLALFGAASGPVAAIDPQVLNRQGSIFLTRPSIVHFIGERTEYNERAAEVFEMVREGELDVHVHAEYPLSDAAEAHRALEGRRTTGKLLLLP
jgi:NADPH2:quinone reductase